MKKAFTLSEVLIALAVIGVVAALTMPSLLQRSEEKIIVSGLQKSIAILDAGFRKIMAEEKASDIRYTDFYRDGDYFMANHPTFKRQFKTANAGEHEYVEYFRGWFNYTYRSCLEWTDDECTGGMGDIQGRSLVHIGPSNNLNAYRPVILSNGIPVWVFSGWGDYPIYVYVDTNGKRGPNTYAYDVQRLGVRKDGHVVPVPANNSNEYNIGALRIKQDGWKLNYKYEN